MRPLRLASLLISGLLLYSTVCFSLEEEKLPGIGFIKNNGSNVRAGDNINFEILCKLEKGDPVKIIDKRYSWFKIALPKTAYLYINNGYVDISSDDDTVGIVNAENVNLRAGPDIKYTILGNASSPEKLNIVSEENGWYKIEPPDKTYGWIHSSMVKFDLE